MRSFLRRWRPTLAAAMLVGVCGLALAGVLVGARVLVDLALPLAAAAALTAGAWSRTTPTGAAVLGGAALMTAANQVADPGVYAVADDAVFFLVVLGCPALAGAGWGARARQARELRRLSVVRAEQLASEVEAARLGETNRIARRVQEDVVQTLGAILVLAEGAAGPGPGDRGEHRQAALAEIERSARSALDQLREHIGWLRSTPERSPGSGPSGPVVAATGAAPPRRPPSSRPPPDLLAALSALPVAVEVAVTDHAFGPTWAAVLGRLALAWPLAQRRRRPWAAVVAYVALALALSLLLVSLDDLVTTILPLVLVGFAVGADVRSWARRLAAGGLLAAGAVGMAAAGPDGLDPQALVATLVVLALAAAAGVVSAASTARVQILDDLVRTVERHRDHEIVLVTARQRHAVARDLHDSVAAAATVICLQAAAARTVPAGDAVVVGTLRAVARTAREAVREIRTCLELVDDAAPGGGGAGRVEDVVAVARRAGLDVRLGAPVPPLAGPAEEVAVRVVREALVNASRHARGTRVSVAVEMAGGAVLVRVSDDGAGGEGVGEPAPGPLGEHPGTGTGLAGLAERLTLLGGTLRHGPLTPRGYEVCARVPLRAGSLPAAPSGVVVLR